MRRATLRLFEEAVLRERVHAKWTLGDAALKVRAGRATATLGKYLIDAARPLGMTAQGRFSNRRPITRRLLQDDFQLSCAENRFAGR